MKFKKISALAELKDESFCFPLGFIDDQNGNHFGYYMELVSKNIACSDFDDLRYLKNQKKLIECIIRASDAIKRIHQQDIILGDIKGENIMIDADWNPKFVDTDNFDYKGAGFDLIPMRKDWLSNAYSKPFKPIDNDKYVYAIVALQTLMKNILISIRQYYAFYKALVDCMNAPKDVKEALLQILSDSENKPYIGDVLRDRSFDDEIITEDDRIKLWKF